jgi:hypothetical protein
MTGDSVHILGLILAPFGTWALISLAFSIKWLIHKRMKDGWLKTQLLKERYESGASKTHRKAFSKYK